ncbi:BNR-4 repeat-containing protein [Paraglaciecola chathamensis]|uniref:BNR-4 repeat-containing protein n=1 Tax=Paraglaciecola chathamensis TaxID=368405 RepID=UPI00270D757B|nr:BNR-4 repeat-containing protein [Paraglaciecola chathamensis]MDO6841813.1 BNR-4 repeat-containing protein [Paraglaciecola chathamensis]
MNGLKMLLFSTTLLTAFTLHAQVTLKQQVKISDEGLHFDGENLDFSNVTTPSTGEKYDYFFGPNISAHGDAVKTYKHFVFMTWYKGGKSERNVMLSRYNTLNGELATIEFPHRHTGFRGDPLVGESHNTIGLAVSPINGTIHMVYDMHAYDNNNHDGKFKNDYFRYSYSVAGAAELSKEEFTIDKFVKDTSEVSQGEDDYKHLTMTGNLDDQSNFARLTYPKFFTTVDGTLLLYMRLGGNNNGAYVFNRYDAENERWSTFTNFNENNQKLKGNPYNWGLYGNMKYVNGKLRVGFQQRSNDNSDKYKYQNGVYYAYSDHPDGFGDWKNHKGEPMTWPLINSDEIKVFEPGDYVSHTDANSVYIVGSFDWTVTEKGDIHIISKVRSTDRSRPDYEEVYIHSYKPAGAEDFIISTDFTGASEIYTSGDNVYIVGLEGGRPYVEKAQGGTNNFVRVYEASDGPTFDHGTLYIKDGKVYYYLMERTSGNAMPLYLQIIDLDLESDANAPIVSFPSPSLTVEQGFEKLSLNIAAESPVEVRTIQSVTLYINDELVRTDDSLPFLFGHGSKPHETGAMGWLDTHEPNPSPLPAGHHIFKAVALDSEGDSSVATMMLTVNSNAPIISFPQESLEVDEGFEKLSLNISAESAVEGRTIESVSLYIDGEFVRTDTSLPYLFGHASKPHETGAMGWLDTHSPNPSPLTSGTYEFTAVAIDSEGEESTATMQLVVKGEPEPPVVTWPNSTVTVYEGYEKLAITIDAESPVEGRDIQSVTLYRNGELVRVDTRPVWNFGHSHAPYEFGAMGWLDRHEPNPAPLSVGTHTFTAVARDSAGLETESDMTLIVLSLPGPSVMINESDISLLTEYQNLSITADASTANDDTSLVSLALYIDDQLVREIYEPPFEWGADGYSNELLELSEGSHLARVVATDSNNKQSESSIFINIDLLGDLNKDSVVDKGDTRLFTAKLRAGETMDIRYDFNGDGVVNNRDTRGLIRRCTYSRCTSN